jgi:diadenosine tetraphosphatase ApaH/serine/threonine PP2A family protein phosphatase
MISYSERSIDDIPGWVSNLAKEDNDFNFEQPDSLEVEYLAGHKYLFNIGSIGQPRNKDPRASFAVIDTDKHIVTRFRLPYDIEKVQNLNLEAGLPPRLAERLAYGN